MGRMALIGMLEVATFESALHWHLQGNHYPPVGFMFDTCKRAINYANKNQWDKRVRLPKGVTYRGKRTAPVSSIVENYHLDEFIEDLDIY